MGRFAIGVVRFCGRTFILATFSYELSRTRYTCTGQSVPQASILPQDGKEEEL
jgi:hypothetical protein